MEVSKRKALAGAVVDAAFEGCFDKSHDFQRHTDVPMYESTIHCADGTERVVETRATFITFNSGQPALLSVIRDITARKRAEESLQESRGLFQAIGESIDYGAGSYHSRDR